MKKPIAYAAKCVLCGFAMCVPGLSGGSMAILLGIYKNMMEIASSFLIKPKKYLLPLVITGFSCLVGVVLWSIFPGRLSAEYENVFIIASAVIVAASLPFYIKNSKIKKLTPKGLLYTAAGGVAVTAIDIILRSGNSPQNQSFGFLAYFLAGFVLSVSLILPGISYPYMLAFIGIYGRVISAINSLELAVLLPLGLGTALGIVALAKSILKIMEKFPFETDCFLLGFTALSTVLIFI